MGARPRYLTRGSCWRRGCRSTCSTGSSPRWRERADAAGVPLVTGDTKVVERGKADGLYINTTGRRRCSIRHSARRRERARAGRRGPGERADRPPRHGDHGGPRRDSASRPRIESDTAMLWSRWWSGCASARRRRGARAARSDPRRRGQRAQRDRRGVRGRDRARGSARCRCPADVAAACEMLGLDPLYVANEGVLVAIVPSGGRRPRSPHSGPTRSVGRRRHRPGRGGAPGPGRAPHGDRRHPDRGHAAGRPAAADLLDSLMPDASHSTRPACGATGTRPVLLVLRRPPAAGGCTS